VNFTNHALRYKQFRIYIAGNFFAIHALWMQRMTLGWIAWDTTQSASFVGVVAFINFMPTLVTGPLFGVWIDRIRVQFAAIATQSLMSVITFLLWLCIALDLLDQGGLILFSLLLGIVASAHHPIRMSLAPRLVERSDIGSVISTTAILFNLARMSGPALGGWLITHWGVAGCLLFQVALYIPFIVALTRLHPRENAASGGSAEPFLRALLTGMRHVARVRVIRNSLIVTGLMAFVVRGVLEILPVIADGVFEKGPSGLGLLLASAGIGALLAGMAKTVIPPQTPNKFPMLAIAGSLAGMATVPLVGITPYWPVAMCLIGVLGFCATLTAISLQTAIQMELSDDLRGRVMSLWTMTAIGASAAGSVVLGFSFDLIGFATTLKISGVAGFLYLLFVVSRL